ncbi:MAG TPA: hypothetical protein VG895_01025 [Patescibacteria group bacterium]|nr:hypothetical protein [Patescibacteria group bacterium]
MTAENIYKNDSRFNIRSAGISKNARHTISSKDILWANIILVMENKHREWIEKNLIKPNYLQLKFLI